MAVVEQVEETELARRHFTSADIAALPSDLPSGPVDYALIQGRLVIMMSPAGEQHGGIQANIIAALVSQGRDRGLGKVRSETGVVLSRNPDTVVGPDAMFVANRSLPIKTSPEGYLESIPNLVVEIRSKNDSLREMDEKVARYLAAGVELVWIVDPPRQTVIAHRRGAPPTEFSPSAVLTAEDIIAGFRLPVADVFVD